MQINKDCALILGLVDDSVILVGIEDPQYVMRRVPKPNFPLILDPNLHFLYALFLPSLIWKHFISAVLSCHPSFSQNLTLLTCIMNLEGVRQLPQKKVGVHTETLRRTGAWISAQCDSLRDCYGYSFGSGNWVAIHHRYPWSLESFDILFKSGEKYGCYEGKTNNFWLLGYSLSEEDMWSMLWRWWTKRSFVARLVLWWVSIVNEVDFVISEHSSE